jgi:rhodanese-related sulfurtransferase
MPSTATLDAQSTMQEVLNAYPGARRALFRHFHIGGCASCGFQPDETLGSVCDRNGLPVANVLAQIEASHKEDLKLLVEPQDLSAQLKSENPPQLLDIRPREEWDAARIEGSELLTRERAQELLSSSDRERRIVIVDHTGKEALDAAAYFAGHGFQQVQALRGGVDAWAQEVDPEMPRYRLE